MEKVLPTIVHFNQCAYVKDRSTFDALRTIEDIMTYSKMKNLQGLKVAIDFEKAFDSVKWNFLYKTLTSFGRLLSNGSKHTIAILRVVS